MTFSVPKSCEEFVRQACFAEHPKHLYSGVPEVLTRCVVRKWVLCANELAEQPDPDPPRGHCADILTGKDLRLFQEMLDASGHVDSKLPDQVRRGFDVMGPLPDLGAMPKRNTFATLTPKEVRENSSATNTAIFHASKASKDLTQEELARAGWAS